MQQTLNVGPCYPSPPGAMSNSHEMLKSSIFGPEEMSIDFPDLEPDLEPMISPLTNTPGSQFTGFEQTKKSSFYGPITPFNGYQPTSSSQSFLPLTPESQLSGINIIPTNEGNVSQCICRDNCRCLGCPEHPDNPAMTQQVNLLANTIIQGQRPSAVEPQSPTTIQMNNSSNYMMSSSLHYPYHPSEMDQSPEAIQSTHVNGVPIYGYSNGNGGQPRLNSADYHHWAYSVNDGYQLGNDDAGYYLSEGNFDPAGFTQGLDGATGYPSSTYNSDSQQ